MLSSDLAKISLLFFYLRLSPERHFRILVQGLVVIFGLYALIYAMISIFGCQPIYANWDVVAQATAKCIEKYPFFLAASIANIVMDFIILLLPLRIVVPLQIPRRQKMSLLFLFTTGGLYVHSTSRSETTYANVEIVSSSSQSTIALSLSTSSANLTTPGAWHTNSAGCTSS